MIEWINKYVKLNKKNNLHWGLCPFHKEITPSFAVNTDKEFFYCFGCGAGGNLITFLMKIENLSFLEANQKLNPNFKLQDNYINLTDIKNILSVLEKRYTKKVDKIYDYLISRGINEDQIYKFNLGYSDNDLYDLNHKILELAGVTVQGHDRLNHRLIIPIKNKQNETIAFAGRNLNNNLPKYINYPNTELFIKSLYLYNENNIIPGRPIILVEGYMDVILLNNLDYNVLGVMGTQLTNEQALKLTKYAQEIILIPDGDSAGQRSINNSLEKILHHMCPNHNLYIIQLPTDKDPGDLYLALPELLKEKIDYISWLNKQKPESIALMHEWVDRWASYIDNKYVKYEFINKLKYKSKPVLSLQNENKEYHIFYLFSLYIDWFEEYLELFLQYKFYSNHLLKYKLQIIDSYSTDGKLEIIQDLFKNAIYNKNLHLSIIMQDIRLGKKYLRDLLTKGIFFSNLGETNVKKK